MTQALKLIPKEHPDLILLDYEMEGMDGKSTFEAMQDDEDMILRRLRRYLEEISLTVPDN